MVLPFKAPFPSPSPPPFVLQVPMLCSGVTSAGRYEKSPFRKYFCREAKGEWKMKWYLQHSILSRRRQLPSPLRVWYTQTKWGCQWFRTNVKVKHYCQRVVQGKDVILSYAPTKSFLVLIPTQKATELDRITLQNLVTAKSTCCYPMFLTGLQHRSFQHLGTPQSHSQPNHPISSLLLKLKSVQTQHSR